MPYTKPNGERDYKRERAQEKKNGDKRGKERAMRVCIECFLEFIPKQNHPRYRFCKSECKDKFHKRKASLEGRTKTWKKLSKERIRELHRKYYYDSKTGRKDQIIENNSIRRSLQKKGNILDTELTSFAFQEAKRLCKLREVSTKIEWHVDHIIPIKNDIVCGLHVWYNFSVIPKIINLQKGNKLCHL